MERLGIGVLIYKNVNLGDWYQSAATMYIWWKYTKSTELFSTFIKTCISEQKLGPYPLYFIDRDRASEFEKPSNIDSILTICNGWWIGYGSDNKTYDFPYPSFISPIFISLHIAHTDLLNTITIDYFKAHAPIGCRDNSTVKKFREKGVDAYFSGCLTMTLNLHDSMLGFHKQIDYSNTHVFNDANLIIDKSRSDLYYAIVTQQSSFPPDPIWILNSVQKNYDLLHAYKVTTKRLHVWLPLMCNRANISLWNPLKKKEFEVGDYDFFSPHADRFDGLYVLKEDGDLREEVIKKLVQDCFVEINKYLNK
jgi:hypothetical protein